MPAVDNYSAMLVQPALSPLLRRSCSLALIRLRVAAVACVTR